MIPATKIKNCLPLQACKLSPLDFGTLTSKYILSGKFIFSCAVFQTMVCSYQSMKTI